MCWQKQAEKRPSFDEVIRKLKNVHFNSYDFVTPAALSKLNKLLVADKRVRCWEAVEVNPTLDTVNKMAENAFDVVEAVVKAVERR